MAVRLRWARGSAAAGYLGRYQRAAAGRDRPSVATRPATSGGQRWARLPNTWTVDLPIVALQDQLANIDTPFTSLPGQCSYAARDVAAVRSLLVADGLSDWKVQVPASSGPVSDGLPSDDSERAWTVTHCPAFAVARAERAGKLASSAAHECAARTQPTVEPLPGSQPALERHVRLGSDSGCAVAPPRARRRLPRSDTRLVASDQRRFPSRRRSPLHALRTTRLSAHRPVRPRPGDGRGRRGDQRVRGAYPSVAVVGPALTDRVFRPRPLAVPGR